MEKIFYILSDKSLVIDPAISSGYCIAEHYQQIGKPLSYEEKKSEGFSIIRDPKVYTCNISSEKGDSTGEICQDIFNHFEKIILKQKTPFTRVAIEQYMFSRGKKTGATLNVSIRTAIIMLCQKHNIPYIIIPISLWKKSVAGRAFPTKEQKALWKSKANKFFILEALKTKYGINFPEKIKSQKSKRMINFKCDISDAIGQAICLSQKTYGEEIYFEIEWKNKSEQ